MNFRQLLKILPLVPLIFFILFGSTEFFLLLRHKSPYISDSYFYKHIFYNYYGDNFEIAYNKVLSQIDFSQTDEISRNFYLNKDQYQDSLRFFTKRPFYPFIAAVIYFFIKNDYWSFLLPVFLAFLGCILLTYELVAKSKIYFFALYSTVGLLLFYPFLDWSTYFLTDTIGTFFWLLQVLLILKIFTTKKMIWFWPYGIILMISFLNREQSFLMVVFFFLVSLLLKRFGYEKKLSQLSNIGMVVSLTITCMYLLIMIITGQKTLYDTVIYTQNNYGLNHNDYSLNETLLYMQNAIYKAHIGFFRDLLSHHWWLVHVFLSIVGGIYVFCIKNLRPTLIDILILVSGFSSYLAIFLYPVLSYRYFIPVVIMIVYFSSQILYPFFLGKPESLYENVYKTVALDRFYSFVAIS